MLKQQSGMSAFQLNSKDYEMKKLLVASAILGLLSTQVFAQETAATAGNASGAATGQAAGAATGAGTGTAAGTAAAATTSGGFFGAGAIAGLSTGTAVAVGAAVAGIAVAASDNGSSTTHHAATSH
jgi:hypothetical protein